MKRLFIAIMLLAGFQIASGQENLSEPFGKAKPEQDKFLAKPLYDTSVQFAERDTCTLSMDLYMPNDTCAVHPCVIFVYGGGFVQNNQRTDYVTKYCRRLADAGFVTAATDYRLGLKGVKSNSVLKLAKNLDVALQASTEDLFSAVKYIIDNSDKLGVDPSQIILIGSSAGAMTVLQADYELGNRTPLASVMPEGFRFAAVVSFSGAIFSHKGKCKWTVQSPAPTLFFHGTSDELVTYDKIQICKLGLFGTNAIVKRFEKYDYPYMCIRFDNRYHEVAAFMNTCFDQTLGFINQFVKEKKNWQVDITVTDPDMDIAQPWSFSTKDIYSKDSKF